MGLDGVGIGDGICGGRLEGIRKKECQYSVSFLPDNIRKTIILLASITSYYIFFIYITFAAQILRQCPRDDSIHVFVLHDVMLLL